MTRHRNEHADWGKLLTELAQEAQTYARSLDEVTQDKRDSVWYQKQSFLQALQDEVLKKGLVVGPSSSAEVIEQKKHLLKTFLEAHEDVLKQRRGHRTHSKFWKLIDRVLERLGLAHWAVRGAKLSGKLHLFAQAGVTSKDVRGSAKEEAAKEEGPTPIAPSSHQSTQEEAAPTPNTTSSHLFRMSEENTSSKAPAAPTTTPLTHEQGAKRAKTSPTANYLSNMPDDVLHIIGQNLNLKDLTNLSDLSKPLTDPSKPSLFSPDVFAVDIKTRTLSKDLFQAIIDDKRETVARLLKDNLELALKAYPKEGEFIESQYTWQHFNLRGLSPLKVACQRKQIEMVKILLPLADQYIESLKKQEEKAKQEQASTPAASAEKEEALRHLQALREKAEKEREEALKAWKPYETQLNANGKKEIVIPQEYQDIITPLIDAFSRENFPHGPLTRDRLSDATEKCLADFRAKLLTKNPISLDLELLLLAVYEIYYTPRFFDQLQTWDQKDRFCINVIGFIQGILPPETARAFCEGCYHVSMRGQPIQAKAASLHFKDDTPFYRSSRETASGLGFEHLAGVGREWDGFPDSGLIDHTELAFYLASFRHYLKQKQQAFEKLPLTETTQPTVHHRR
jgi:hypothetical protein